MQVHTDADVRNEIPTRDHMEDPGIVWREGKPNYDAVNKKYMEGRTMRHKAGSLEKIVENLVKTWEMESSHKIREQDWGTIDREKFFINSNGGKKFSLQDNIRLGNYNMLLDQCPLYNAAGETNESSHKLFRSAFSAGYPWEVLEVQSGPPVVSFTWRHWGTFDGPYGSVPPTGETLEMYGSGVVRVTDELKILSIEIFYDPNPTMVHLTGFKMANKNGCPFLNDKN